MTELDDALRAHLIELGFVTEEGLKQTLADIADEIGNERPPPVDPTPPAPSRRLPAEDFIFLVDPNIPDTMNANRPFGQVWAAGDLLQKNQTRSYLFDRLPEQHRAGYGLTMNELGQVHSFRMEDQTTVRYGPFQRAGQWRFRLASQFRLGDGYTREGNEWFGGWRINTKVDRTTSDAHTFDAPRSELSAIEADIAFGETVTWYFEIEGHRYMHGSASTNGPIDMHMYGHKYSGPFFASISRGRINFGGKRFGQQVITDRVSNGDLSDIHCGSIAAPMPGERLRVVVQSRIEAGNNMVKVWTVTDQDMRLEVDHADVLWYQFDDERLNQKNYAKVQCYPWREHNYPGSDRVIAGHPLWNHDPSAGNVISSEFGCVGVTKKHGPEAVGAHMLSYPI